MINENICQKCQGRGIILMEDYAVPCSCMKQKALQKRFGNSRLSPVMRKYTFSDFNFDYYSKTVFNHDIGKSYYDTAQLTYNAAKKFAADFLRNSHTDGLLIMGHVGSGKTFLACCIANELLNKGQEVIFVVVPDLLDELKATYNYNSGDSEYTEQQLIETARTAPLLILDDLGAHNYSDWVKNKLYTILNYRLNNCLATIITSNISLEDLSDALGERTTSRIYQLCKPYRLQTEHDIRACKRKEKSSNR